MSSKLKATEEQIAYAYLLDWGMKIGLVLLVITFGVYMVGLLPTHIPVNDLPKYWGMPVHTYLEHTGIKPGWAWVGMVGKAEFLNFIGIALLSGVTIICYLRILPGYLKQKDFIYAAIVVLEVLTLALAASGILRAGAH